MTNRTQKINEMTSERIEELRRRLEEARGDIGALARWAEEHGEELLETVLDLDRRLAYYEPDMYVKRCSACHGRGRREYPDTSTWRGGGYAGQAITTDICDKCWGTGDEGRPGTDLRAMVQRHREHVDKAIDVAVHTALTMAADSSGPVDLWSLHEAAVRRAKERLTDPNLEIEKRGAQT